MINLLTSHLIDISVYLTLLTRSYQLFIVIPACEGGVIGIT